MKGHAEIFIDRPLDKVWDFVADVRNMEGWVAGVTQVTVGADGARAAGAVFSGRYAYGGRTYDIQYRVVEWRPPELQVIQATSGPFPFVGTMRLETQGSGTRLCHTVEAGANGFGTRLMFAAFGPLLRAGTQRQLRNELRALKYLAERR